MSNLNSAPWIFYQDKHKNWRWKKTGQHEEITKSLQYFSTLRACKDNARIFGYQGNHVPKKKKIK